MLVPADALAGREVLGHRGGSLQRRQHHLAGARHRGAVGIGHREGDLVADRVAVVAGRVVHVPGRRHPAQPLAHVALLGAAALRQLLGGERPGAGQGRPQPGPLADQHHPDPERGAQLVDHLAHQLVEPIVIHRHRGPPRRRDPVVATTVAHRRDRAVSGSVMAPSTREGGVDGPRTGARPLPSRPVVRRSPWTRASARRPAPPPRGGSPTCSRCSSPSPTRPHRPEPGLPELGRARPRPLAPGQPRGGGRGGARRSCGWPAGSAAPSSRRRPRPTWAWRCSPPAAAAEALRSLERSLDGDAGRVPRAALRLAAAEASVRAGDLPRARAHLDRFPFEPVGAADDPDGLVARLDRVTGLAAAGRGRRAGRDRAPRGRRGAAAPGSSRQDAPTVPTASSCWP